MPAAIKVARVRRGKRAGGGGGEAAGAAAVEKADGPGGGRTRGGRTKQLPRSKPYRSFIIDIDYDVGGEGDGGGPGSTVVVEGKTYFVHYKNVAGDMRVLQPAWVGCKDWIVAVLSKAVIWRTDGVFGALLGSTSTSRFK